MTRHEPTDQPNWQTKIVCTCGHRSSHWMEFHRHRGDAYKGQLVAVIAAVQAGATGQSYAAVVKQMEGT